VSGCEDESDSCALRGGGVGGGGGFECGFEGRGGGLLIVRDVGWG
jgi:hypothetical protein